MCRRWKGLNPGMSSLKLGKQRPWTPSEKHYDGFRKQPVTLGHMLFMEILFSMIFTESIPCCKWYKMFWGFPILMGQLQLDPHKKTRCSWFLDSSIFKFTTTKKTRKTQGTSIFHGFSMVFPWFFHGFVLFKRAQALEMIQNGLVLPTVAKRQKKDLGGSQKPLRLVMPWFIQIVDYIYITYKL